MKNKFAHSAIVVDDVTEFGTIGVVVRLTPEQADAFGADARYDATVDLDEALAANGDTANEDRDDG